MAWKSGTPLWATLVVALATLIGGHLLTIHREGKKSHKDRVEDWKKRCSSLLDEIIKDAITHYCDESSKTSTHLSAAKINYNLKKLSEIAREFQAKDSSKSAEINKLLRRLRDEITDPEDFQNKDRAIRKSDDAMFESINETSRMILLNIRSERKFKQ